MIPWVVNTAGDAGFALAFDILYILCRRTVCLR
jgi:hypothetical protein